MRKYIRDHEMIPTGYRVSWWNVETKRAACYPIGIHWIAKFIHRYWERSFQYTPTKWEEFLTRIELEHSNRYSDYHEIRDAIEVLQKCAVRDEKSRSWIINDNALLLYDRRDDLKRYLTQEKEVGTMNGPSPPTDSPRVA